MHEITPVRVVIDLGALAVAQPVTVDLVGAVGVVEFAEEQGLIIVGPGHAAVAIFEGERGHLACLQVLDEQLIDLVALCVEAVSQLAVVLADTERAQRQEASRCQLVGVEQELLASFIHGERAIRRARAAVVARIFIASRGALVIEPGSPGGGQRKVGLPDTAFDLEKQRFTQLVLVSQLFFQIGIFRFQVIEHLGCVAVLQPLV